MSLAALHHRKLTTVTSASNGIVDMLNAIWTAVQPSVTTYVDGTTRTFSGSGTGWTWTRYQNGGVTEAIYASPPTGSLAQRIIIAGATTTPTPSPTMLIDTYLANRLHIGLVKNAGAFNAWNAASPFTTGQFTGYVQLATNVPTAPITFTVYESEETVQIAMGTASAGAIYGAGAGALVDPDTGDAADGESDGRIYGLWTGGSSTLATMLTNATTNVFLGHGGSATNSHFVTFNPGLATTAATTRTNFHFSMTVNSYTSRAGKYPTIPIYCVTTANWCGRVREIRVMRPATSGARIDASGVNKGYVYATNASNATDAVLLQY